MKLLLTNPQLDEQIKLAKKYIKLSMNGVTADSMSDNGIKYKSNLGVSIPRIKEIAGYFSPNADLSRRLWLLGGRETMILSLLLYPSGILTINDAEQFISAISNIELAEQTAMLLFSKSEFASEIANKCLISDNAFVVVAGLLTLSRVYNKINAESANNFVVSITKHLPSSNFHIYKAAANCLSRFCRISESIASVIITRLNSMIASADDKSLTFTKEIIQQEITFLNYSI